MEDSMEENRKTHAPAQEEHQAQTLTHREFIDKVIFSELPVLVEFWAPWCSACRMLAPVVKRVAAENSGRCRVYAVNVEEEAMLAARYAVRSVPKLLLFENGKVIGSTAGFQTERKIEEKLLGLLGKSESPA